MKTVSEYIDFSENSELRKEAERMGGLGQSILEEGMAEGIEKGMAEGIEKGMAEGIEKGIKALILDNLEERIPREKIIGKLQRRFEMTRERAEKYYERYEGEE